MLCASAIYRLAEEEESRDLVRMHGGLEPLVELVQDHDNQADKVSYIIAAYYSHVKLDHRVYCRELSECLFPKYQSRF